jgi:hypothetical protein
VQADAVAIAAGHDFDNMVCPEHQFHGAASSSGSNHLCMAVQGTEAPVLKLEALSSHAEHFQVLAPFVCSFSQKAWSAFFFFVMCSAHAFNQNGSFLSLVLVSPVRFCPEKWLLIHVVGYWCVRHDC